jgi:hypothetical protein
VVGLGSSRQKGQTDITRSAYYCEMNQNLQPQTVFVTPAWYAAVLPKTDIFAVNHHMLGNKEEYEQLMQVRWRASR